MNIIELTKKAVELTSKNEKLKKRTKDTVASIVMVLKKNEEEHSFTLAVNKGKLEFLEGRIAAPDFQFEISEKDYSDLMTGKAYGMILMATGKMKMTKGSWAQIRKIAAPLGMIPKAGKEIAAKEQIEKIQTMFKRKKRPKGTPPIAGREVKEKEFAAAGERAAIIDAMPDALIVLDLNGVIVYTNPAFTKMFGFKLEERIGKSIDELGESLKAEDIERFMKLLRKLVETGWVEPVETVIRTKDGREIPASVTYSLIKDAKDNPKNIIALLRDITETKKLISDLEERKVLIDNIFGCTIDSVAIINLDGAIVDISKAAFERSGYSKEEMTGDIATFLVSEEDRAKFPDLIREVIEKGFITNVEMTEITKDGRKIPVMFNAALMRDAKGEPTGIVAVARDITETKKLISELEEAKATLEDKVKERTANLTALQEISTVLASTMDLRETLTLILESLEKKLGYLFTAIILVNREKNCLDNYMLGPSVPAKKVAKMVGVDFATVSIPLTAKGNMLVQTVLTGEPQFTHDLYDYARPVVGKHLIAPVQKMLGIELVGTVPLTTDEEVLGVLGFARKTKEPLTEEEMGILKTFTNQAGLAVERAKIYRDLEESTKALQEAKNYTDSVIKSMTDTLVVVSPEGDIQTVNDATCAMLGYEEKELIGQPVGKILAEEEEEEVSLFKGSGLDDLIKKGFISNVEKTYLAKDGRKIPVLFSGSVMRGGDGKIQGIVCMAQDITEHKEAEEQSLRSEKLAGIELLANSIAHELGNPLSIMSSTLQYVRDDLLNTGDRQLIEAIDTIMDSIGQMHGLVGSLSEFTGSQRSHFESTDLCRILSRMLSFIRKEAETHKIKIYHQFDENLPNCQVDPGEIKQLFLNLFKNAIEAMPNGGELHVRMHLLESKDAVHIEVSDTGHGISETDLGSIFRPFYSTKPDGTGLGLSFCRHVVEEHGGEITVKSDLGKGSTFSVILPLRQKGTDKSDE